MIGGIIGHGPALAFAPVSGAQNTVRPDTKLEDQNSATPAARQVAGINSSPDPHSIAPSSESGTSRNAANPDLTEEQERVVAELKDRDAEVRAHEQAHAAVGGSYASAPSYEYTRGPDGRQYAIGGEVQIDTAPVRGNPEATIDKMTVVIAAALAPAEPSSQDMAVARQAQQTRAQAQSELGKLRFAESLGKKGTTADKRSPVSAQYTDSRRLQAHVAYGNLEENKTDPSTAKLFEALQVHRTA